MGNAGRGHHKDTAHLGGQQSDLLGHVLRGTLGFFKFLNLCITFSHLNLKNRDNVNQAWLFQKLTNVKKLCFFKSLGEFYSCLTSLL